MCIGKHKLAEAYNSFCFPVLPFSSLYALEKLSHGTWGKYRSHKVVMILLSMSYRCLNTPSSFHEFGGFELSSLCLESSIFHIKSLYLLTNIALNQKLKIAWNKLFNYSFLMPKKINILIYLTMKVYLFFIFLSIYFKHLFMYFIF